MSLQVWLPLNGNIENHGLLEDVSVATPPTYADSGKIGKCLKSGKLYITASQANSILNNKEFSFACWVYPNRDAGASPPYSEVMLFNRDSMGNPYRQYSVFMYPNINSLHLGWQSAPYGEQVLNVMMDVLPSYTWTHVCVTYNNPTVKVYINGVLSNTFSANMNCSSYEYDTPLMSSSEARYLNDYRIYDHCLSAKEVKEISKGLICHYKLDNNGFGNPNLINTDNPLEAGGRTVVTDKKLIISAIDTTADTYFTINLAEAIQADVEYTLSCDVEDMNCNTNWNFPLFAQDNPISKILVISPNTSKASITFTVPAGSSYVGKTIIFMDDGGRPSTNPNDITLSNFKLEKGSVATPWCPHTSDSLYTSLGLDSTTELDCSGYGSDGTKVGNIAYENSSVRYDGCYSFTGDDYIKIPKPVTISNSSYFTVSMWVKPESGCGEYATVLSNFSEPASGFWMAINTEDSGTWFYNGTYAKGNSLLPIDQWSHIAMVFNAGTITWYTNGAATSTSNVSSNTTAFTDYIAIGNSYAGTTWNTDFVGNISDFRIYSTALSASDVKELYNTSASIDRNGNMYAYEFKEE